MNHREILFVKEERRDNLHKEGEIVRQEKSFAISFQKIACP